MLQNPKPLYAILCIILIFIFLWFFCGGGHYKFIGINPLKPENITDYPDSYEHVRYHAKSEEDMEKSELESIYENAEEDICIDITPALPPEFVKHQYENNDGKFTSKGEKICRETMEKIYGVPFKNTRPSWLKNDLTGRCLELDCYNEKLKLAVEYDGKHHSVFPNFLKQTYKEFKDQMRRDQLKKELCKKHGIHLINVPYTVSFDLIPTYIMYHLPEIVQQRLKNDQILN